MSQRFVPVLDKGAADKLFTERLLWVANRGKENWQLDETTTLPSMSWEFDYAILCED